MHYLRIAFVFQLLLIYSFGLPAQAIDKQFLSKPLQNNFFIKEQGQFSKNAVETKTPFNEPVLYGLENPEFNAYFTAQGIIFQYPERKNIEKKEREEEGQKGKKDERDVETIWHTATMHWLNSNASVELIPEQKESAYYNYGGFNDNTHYNFVPAYKKIKYSNLYPGVDVEFELSEQGGLKYKFLVQPNVVIPLISFQWDGLEKISTDEKGDLHLLSKFNSFAYKSQWQLLDHAPDAFSSVSHTNIPLNFAVTGDKVEFQFSSENISSPEGIIIDPWITNPNFSSLNKAFDIQEDSLGNVFIIGNNTNWEVQKYNSIGVLQWTYVTYAILMGDIAVDNPGNVYIIGGYSAGKRQKLDPSGVQLWSFGGLMEEWRLAFNYSKTILSVGGYFIDPGSNNLAKLDINTGAVSDEIIYGAETRGIATDCNGDIYSLHVTFGYSGAAASNVLRKTNSNFTPAGSVLTGFLLAEAQPASTCYGLNPAYSGSYTYQVFNAIAVNGPYVFIYDGATIRRINKTTLTIVNSVSVPNGTLTMCGGIAADLCGNIYAGGMNGIAKFDSALTYISTIPTPAAVYDVILGSSGELLACGEGFLGSFATGCIAPPSLTATATSTNASCKGGSATVFAVGGVAPYSYSWQPGGQTTVTVNNLAAGTYTYTVTDPFCHTYQDTITVNQIPPLTLTPGLINVVSPGVVSNESCPNSLDGSVTVSAAGGTGPYLYSWNTNPVQYSQTATGLSEGIYLATVIDADTCTDTVSVVITRNPAPIAVFGSTKVCNGNATQFIDSSTTTFGVIDSWAWDFGDGSIDSAQNPSPIYANAGNYSATLIVNNNFGCADTITKPVQVYFNPLAGFSFNDVCFGDSMHFTNTSSVDPSTSIAKYLWVFGDGSATSNLQNPNHYYSIAGTYSVSLVTTTIDSCSDAITKTVNAFDAPTSAFTFSNTCLLDSAKFTNSSLNPVMGSIANWSWDFGDSSSLNTTVWSPNHLYAPPGNYLVTLITHSSNLGCPDTLKDSITVFPMPVANFVFANVCLNQTMDFNDSSSVSSGTIASWSWDFGDNTTSDANQNPNHLYTNPGTYTVSLIVTTNNGCKDTITKNVVVHPLPAALFSTVNVCDGSTVTFNDLSNIPSTDTIHTWTWNYGDSSPSSVDTNTSHLYAAAGTYSVQLLVISNFGCTDFITKISIVNPNPIPMFIADDTIGCEPLCINFQNLSSILTGNNTQWLWNVGDGSPTINSENPNHCYSNDFVYSPNFFNVTLTVTSDSGCVSTISKPGYITVYPNPNAGFTVQPQTTTITDPLISITDLSTGANYWNWNFGDGSAPLTTGSDTSTVSNLSPHTYADTGIYIITLITTTKYGCVSTAFENITIEPDFIFYVPNAFTPDGDGINDSFTGKGIFIKEFQMSIFDRWGNMIFFTEDINKPWDGKANHGADIAQGDVYVYSIKVTDYKRGKHSYKGIVTLVR